MYTMASQLEGLLSGTAAVRYHACGRKACYEHVSMAMHVAMRRKTVVGLELFAYPCPYGDHWHLSRRAPTPEEGGRAELRRAARLIGAQFDAPNTSWAEARERRLGDLAADLDRLADGADAAHAVDLAACDEAEARDLETSRTLMNERYGATC